MKERKKERKKVKILISSIIALSLSTQTLMIERAHAFDAIYELVIILAELSGGPVGSDFTMNGQMRYAVIRSADRAVVQTGPGMPSSSVLQTYGLGQTGTTGTTAGAPTGFAWTGISAAGLMKAGAIILIPAIIGTIALTIVFDYSGLHPNGVSDGGTFTAIASAPGSVTDYIGEAGSGWFGNNTGGWESVPTVTGNFLIANPAEYWAGIAVNAWNAMCGSGTTTSIPLNVRCVDSSYYGVPNCVATEE